MNLPTLQAVLRKSAGIVLVTMGVIWVGAYAVLKLKIQLPISAVLHYFGIRSFGFYVDPVVAPTFGGLFLFSGLVLLWWSRPTVKSHGK